MPRKKTQNKIEISKSLEKYNTTLNSNKTIDKINIIQDNSIQDNTIQYNNIQDNSIEKLLDNIKDETKINTKKKSLDTFFFNNNSQVSPLSSTLSTSPLSTAPLSNRITNSISSSDSDDETELLNINTTLSLPEIKNRIDKLYEEEFVEIFKIIKSNNEKFTTNSNGIFINICNLKTTSINEITKFLIFSENNNKLIKKEEKERNIYRECVS